MTNEPQDPTRPDESGWELPEFDLEELGPRRSAFCVLIPVINEGERIRAQLVRMQTENSGLDIVIADGGSADGSLEPVIHAERPMEEAAEAMRELIDREVFGKSILVP